MYFPSHDTVFWPSLTIYFTTLITSTLFADCPEYTVRSYSLRESYGRLTLFLSHSAVTVHRQVAKDLGAGRMVGQLKLVFLKQKLITHWEYNVKYFVDAGSFLGGVGGGAGETKDLSCGDDSTRENDSTSHENDSTRHSRDAREPPMAVPSCSQQGHAKDKGLADQAAYLGWSFPSRLGRDLADLKTFKDANRRPPPSGNSCCTYRAFPKSDTPTFADFPPVIT